MKLRVVVSRVARLADGSHEVLLTAADTEAPEFVPRGPAPGRRLAAGQRLHFESLTRQAAAAFEPGGEFVVTLEPIAKR